MKIAAISATLTAAPPASEMPSAACSGMPSSSAPTASTDPLAPLSPSRCGRPSPVRRSPT